MIAPEHAALADVPRYPGFRLSSDWPTAGATHLGGGYLEFAPGTAIEDWRLTYDEVVVVTEGELVISSAEATWSVPAGTACVITAGSTVTYSAPGGARGVVVIAPA